MSSSLSASNSQILIAFDVECTGYDLMKHAMVELGAVVYPFSSFLYNRIKLEKEFFDEPLDRFDEIMNIPEDRGWEEKCVKEFWDNPKRPEYKQLKAKMDMINSCPNSPEKIMLNFVQWVKNVVHLYADDDSSRIRFISDNAAYDATWISVYLCQYAHYFPLTVFFDNKFQAVIDTSSFHQGISRIDHNREKLIKIKSGHYSEDRLCRKILNIPENIAPKILHDHHAVNDADEIAQQHMIILAFASRYVSPLDSSNP